MAADTVELLKPQDLGGWKLKGDAAKSNWKRGKAAAADSSSELTTSDGAELVNVKGGGVDIFTDKNFGDALVELEVMVPKGSNSGVYLMGEYEIQVFDSFGKKDVGMGDIGAIYRAAVPKSNASKPPASGKNTPSRFADSPLRRGWQENRKRQGRQSGPQRSGNSRKCRNRRPNTGGLTGKEAATGPLMFQGDHGAVSYRNVKVTPQ